MISALFILVLTLLTHFTREILSRILYHNRDESNRDGQPRGGGGGTLDTRDRYNIELIGKGNGEREECIGGAASKIFPRAGAGPASEPRRAANRRVSPRITPRQVTQAHKAAPPRPAPPRQTYTLRALPSRAASRAQWADFAHVRGAAWRGRATPLRPMSHTAGCCAGAVLTRIPEHPLSNKGEKKKKGNRKGCIVWYNPQSKD